MNIVIQKQQSQEVATSAQGLIFQFSSRSRFWQCLISMCQQLPEVATFCKKGNFRIYVTQPVQATYAFDELKKHDVAKNGNGSGHSLFWLSTGLQCCTLYCKSENQSKINNVRLCGLFAIFCQKHNSDQIFHNKQNLYFSDKIF